MRKLLFISTLVLALTTLVANPAYAAPSPIIGSGTWTPDTRLHPPAPGDNLVPGQIYHLTGTVTLKGTLEATCQVQYQVVLDPTRPEVTYDGKDTCIGEIAGKKGTWTDIVYNVIGPLGPIYNDMVMIGRGGELAGMHGHLWLVSPSDYTTEVYLASD